MNYCRFRNETIKRMANSGGATPILPDEYQQVKWLQSTGTQYINTGITLPSNYERLEIKLQCGSYSSNSRYFGSYSAANKASIIGYSNSGPLDRIYLGRTTVNVTTTQSGIDYTIDVTADNGTITGVWCGANVNATYSGLVGTNQSASMKEYVFAQSEAPSGISKGNAKIYYYRLHTSNGLACDFVPCYRKSDNKPGMYDLVTNTFFTNAGTGEFTVGSNV